MNEVLKLNELAQYMSTFFFNMRTLHFLTSGKEFYTYHSLAEELYQQAEDYYDDLVETAISYNEGIKSMADVSQEDLLSTNDTYNAETTQNLIHAELEVIFEALKLIDKNYYDSFVYSKIDSMKEYFNKQIYKIIRSIGY